MAPELEKSPARRGQDNEKVIGRILALSDGVVAIAILLLLIDIRLPADTSTTDLGASLWSLWPNYLAFFISFVVIGLYLSAHVRLFREIVRYDWVLVWLNLLYLLFIVIIPFATTVLSTHYARLSVIVYAATMACAGYTNTILRIYSTEGNRLVSGKLGHAYIKKAILLSLIAPSGFIISIGLAFLNSSIGQYFWIAMLIIHIIFLRRLKPQER